MAGKEGIFAILDVSKTMERQYDENLSRLECGIESIRHLIRQKLLFNPKDQIGIILKGVEEPVNQKDYEGIAIARSLNFPTIKLFDDLEGIATQEGQGDLLDAIDVALDEFDKEYGKKKWNKRIFLITDGEGAITNDEDQIRRIAKILASQEVKLNVIAIDFFNEVEDDEEESNVGKKESKNQLKTKECLNKFMEYSDNVRVFTAKMANSIYKQFRKKKVNPVTKFRGPLLISPSVYLDVAVYTKTSKVDVPSLKKHSLATEVNTEDIKSGGITLERVYYVNDDQDQNPLAAEYITKAYNYGNSLVPISKTDEVLFKNQEKKCLKTIGFTDSFRVPRHHFMGGVDMVVPNPESKVDIKAFTAIVQEMKDMNKVMICRYVYRENADPKLVVLSPHLGKNGPALYLNNLPTTEDIRDYQFESLKECTMKQEEVVSKFIDSLDLEKEDEEGEKEEVLKPTETFNPVLQYFYQSLEHKALNKSNNLPSLDETIEDYLRPDKKLFEGNKFVTFLPKMFDIQEKVQKEDKKKRVFWKDMINSEIQENTGISEKRLEEKLEAHKEEAKKNISTTRAIEDFKDMINYKYADLTIDAMEQMKNITIKFIVESFKGSYYIKAMECLKELREACIEYDEVVLFNIFLDKLRHDFPKEKFLDFWKLILDNRISLISDKENVKSSVKDEESKMWLESIREKEIITSTLNDMDELIADID